VPTADRDETLLPRWRVPPGLGREVRRRKGRLSDEKVRPSATLLGGGGCAGWRRQFTTFEEYVEERWDWDVRHCERLISAADAAEKLRPIGRILPASESYVRELLKIEDDGDRL
jgi:hypothetical protein